MGKKKACSDASVGVCCWIVWFFTGLGLLIAGVVVLAKIPFNARTDEIALFQTALTRWTPSARSAFLARTLNFTIAGYGVPLSAYSSTGASAQTEPEPVDTSAGVPVFAADARAVWGSMSYITASFGSSVTLQLRDGATGALLDTKTLQLSNQYRVSATKNSKRSTYSCTYGALTTGNDCTAYFFPSGGLCYTVDQSGGTWRFKDACAANSESATTVLSYFNVLPDDAPSRLTPAPMTYSTTSPGSTTLPAAPLTVALRSDMDPYAVAVQASSGYMVFGDRWTSMRKKGVALMAVGVVLLAPFAIALCCVCASAVRTTYRIKHGSYTMPHPQASSSSGYPGPGGVPVAMGPGMVIMQNPSSPHPMGHPPMGHPMAAGYPMGYPPSPGFPGPSPSPSGSSGFHTMSTSGAPLPGGGFTAPASGDAGGPPQAPPPQPFQYPPTAGFFSVLASTMASTVSATGKPFAPVAGGLSRGARVVRMTMTPSARRLVAPPTQVAKPGHSSGSSSSSSSGSGSSGSGGGGHGHATAAPMTAGPPPPQAPSPASPYPSAPGGGGGGGVLASHLGHGAGGGIEMQMQGVAQNPLLTAGGAHSPYPQAGSPLGYPYSPGSPMGNVPMQVLAGPGPGPAPYGYNPYAAAVGAAPLSPAYGRAV